MKVFQIVNDICYSDVTKKFPTAASTAGRFTPETLFVDAPDYVFQDWGYDGTKTGDARFTKPVAPSGWLYDDATGTFYPEGEMAPSQAPTLEERVAAIESAQTDIYAELAAAYTEGVNSI